MKKKTFNLAIYCGDCKLEAIPTENGILCSACGAYISDAEMEEMAERE